MKEIKCTVCGKSIMIAWYERIMQESLGDAIMEANPLEHNQKTLSAYPVAECDCTERENPDRPTVAMKDVEEYSDMDFWKEWCDVLLWVEGEE